MGLVGVSPPEESSSEFMNIGRDASGSDSVRGSVVVSGIIGDETSFMV